MNSTKNAAATAGIARAGHRRLGQEQPDHVAAARRDDAVEAVAREVGAPDARNSICASGIGGAQDVERGARAQRQVDREADQREQQREPVDRREVREEGADRVEERGEGVAERGDREHAHYLRTAQGRTNAPVSAAITPAPSEAEARIGVVERQPQQRRGRVAGELEGRDHRRPARAVARHRLDRERVDARPRPAPSRAR